MITNGTHPVFPGASRSMAGRGCRRDCGSAASKTSTPTSSDCAGNVLDRSLRTVRSVGGDSFGTSSARVAVHIPRPTATRDASQHRQKATPGVPDPCQSAALPRMRPTQCGTTTIATSAVCAASVRAWSASNPAVAVSLPWRRASPARRSSAGTRALPAPRRRAGQPGRASPGNHCPATPTRSRPARA